MKEFVIKFEFAGNQIQTQMKMKNVTQPEAIGLLEMAKNQIVERLKKGSKDILEMRDK